jgi:DNA-binding phage protein
METEAKIDISSFFMDEETREKFQSIIEFKEQEPAFINHVLNVVHKIRELDNFPKSYRDFVNEAYSILF